MKIQPTIRCPQDIRVTLSEGRATHNVTVPKPQTNMKNREAHPPWVRANKSVEFPAGETIVTFTAISDISDETASCEVTVTVLGKYIYILIFNKESITNLNHRHILVNHFI